MPTDDDIRTHAYHLWERAGRPPSDGVGFWLTAERIALGRPIETFPLDGTLSDVTDAPASTPTVAPTAPLNALLNYMTDPDAAPLDEGERRELAPGWELKLERPGDALPPFRRFYPNPEASIDPAYNAAVAARPDAIEAAALADRVLAANTEFQIERLGKERQEDADRLRRTQKWHLDTRCQFLKGSPLPCANVDPAAGRDKTVLAEVLVRSGEPSIVRRVVVMEPGDDRHPHAIVTDPPELAGRLARLEATCREDEAKIKKALERRRAKRAERAAAEARRKERDVKINALVPPEHRADFCEFVSRGKASDEFLKFLETDKKCQEAVALCLDAQSEILREFFGKVAAAEGVTAREVETLPELPAVEPPPEPVPTTEPAAGVGAWVYRNSLCRCGWHRWQTGAGGQWCPFCNKSRS